MSKRRGVALAAGAVSAAVQPRGLRRVAAALLLVLLAGALLLGGGMALLVWWAGRPPAGLPCPATGPVTVKVAETFPAAPIAAQEAVRAALERAGRTVKTAGPGEAAAVRVVWVPGTPLTASGADSPVVVTIGAEVTAAEVQAALAAKGHLPSCAAAAPTPTPAAPGSGGRWPWEGETAPAGAAALLLLAWWAIGPEAARLAGRGLAWAGRPVVVVARRAVRWMVESGERRDRREEARRDSLVAEQIAASQALRLAQENAEQGQAEREVAEFQRFWEAAERHRIEREEAK